jgi:hypothetical protein
MFNDNQTQNPIIPENEALTSEMAVLEPTTVQPTDPIPTSTAPIAPESPINAPTPVPVEDQNGAVNQAESEMTEPTKEPEITEPVSMDTSQSIQENRVQPQSDIQQTIIQNQPSFIRTLLAKAQAKIQFNKQKKLDKIIQFASTKGKITNDEVQKLLRISDKTSERYLKKLVLQGKLQKFGSIRDAHYEILH